MAIQFVLFLLLAAAAVAPLAAVTTLVGFFEWRRNRRIRRGLPVDDRYQPEYRGFDIEPSSPQNG